MKHSNLHNTTVFKHGGIALVVVLWALMLLSVMAMSFIAYVRDEVRLTRNTHDSLRAQFMAEGGIYRGIAMMLHSNPNNRWPVDGSVHSYNTSDGKVEVAVLSEHAKIDINYASPDILDGLFATVNIPLEARKALVAAILDWRDFDSLPNDLGAEDAEYQRMGFAYGAKDAPLSSIDELRLIPGMTQQIFNTVKNVLTVYSGSASINTSFAPVRVLAAMYAGDISKAERQIEQRRNSFSKKRLPGATAGTGTIYSISSIAKTAAGTVAGIVVTVDANVHTENGYRILSWEPITEKCQLRMGDFACYE